MHPRIFHLFILIMSFKVAVFIYDRHKKVDTSEAC